MKRILSLGVIIFLSLTAYAHIKYEISNEFNTITSNDAIKSIKAEKPLRIGIKLGLPNVAGLGVEYLTPLLNNRLSGAIDFSYIPLSPALDPTAVTTAKFTHWSLGLNYYFFKPGSGLYGGISTGNANLNFKSVMTEPTSGTTATASASANVGYPIMIKLGAKLGKGFYFRPEIGYAVANFPSAIRLDFVFPTMPSENTYENIDVSGISIPFVINIGFGVAF